MNLLVLLGALLRLSSVTNQAAPELEKPVSAPLPDGVDPAGNWRLVRVADGKELPVQIVAGTPPVAVWLDRGGAAVRLERKAPASFPVLRVTGTKDLTVEWAGKEVLRYRALEVPAPSGVNPAYGRSGYLHPLWTPAGRMISNDFPKTSEHHHGLWLAWRIAEFEGRSVNGWAPLEKSGKVEFEKLEETSSGPVFGGFTVRHRFVDLTTPDKPKTVLHETWSLRVYATQDTYLFDLESIQTCASDSPLTVRKHYYGGLGFRGSSEWEGKESVAFLTSEGRTRVDGNGLPARWVAMNGTIAGNAAGIGFLGSPSNLRAPQATRLHPYEPFFCWVPAHDDDFTIEPGKPLVSRYRFVVADRVLDQAEMKQQWEAYAEAPPGKLSVAK
jgi:hypothetical protein